MNVTFATITGRSDDRLISAPGGIRVWVRDHDGKTKTPLKWVHFCCASVGAEHHS